MLHPTGFQTFFPSSVKERIEDSVAYYKGYDNSGSDQDQRRDTVSFSVGETRLEASIEEGWLGSRLRERAQEKDGSVHHRDYVSPTLGKAYGLQVARNAAGQFSGSHLVTHHYLYSGNVGHLMEPMSAAEAQGHFEAREKAR